jgi:outer membrane protein with beta-barrel domain
MRSVAIAAALTPSLVSATLAQRRTAAETGIARRDVKPAATAPAPRVAQPQPTPATAGPQWSMFGGVASGDNPYDIGIALGADARWHRPDWPVAVRGDGYFAHHGGDIGGGAVFGSIDLSINIFGVLGSAEYSFPTTSTLKPYVFGGLGLFYSSVNVDYNGAFNDNAYDSSTDLGLGIGAGLYFTHNFGMELRFMDIGGFNTIPILAVLHF